MFDPVFWFKALELILCLSLLVFVHEFGHFMWARIFKVGVEKFYLFFDAYNFALLRWNKKGLHLFDLIHFPTLVNPSETEYGIGWVPLGGYCAIVGMIDETHDAEHADMDRPDAFVKKGKFAQFMIMVGGVLNNIILAILIYVGMAWYWGKDIVEPKNLPNGAVYSELAKSVGFQDGDIVLDVDGRVVNDFISFPSSLLLGNAVTVERNGQKVTIQLPDTLGQHFLSQKEDLILFASPREPFVIAGFVEDSPAANAGFQVGDSIVMCDSIPMPFFDQFKAYVSSHPLDTVQISFYRAGELMTQSLVLNEKGMMGARPRAINLRPYSTHVEFSFFEAIPYGIKQGYEKLYDYVAQFKLVFTKQGAKELGGFGTMGSIFPEEWIWKAFWSLTAFISVALAFMNILPIPALDGGHIMILIIEAIIRRPLPNKVKDILQYIGFGFILILMIAVNANDIIKFFF